MSTLDRKLRIFLCHASQDNPIVRELYQKLVTEGWIDPWLDEEKLLPGMDWDMEIEKAVEAADAVIVCLSKNSISKEGYVQKELRFVLDIADEKPEETIFVIPLRVDDCLRPRRLKKWQYVDYFPEERRTWALNRVLESFSFRARSIGINGENTKTEAKNEINKMMSLFQDEDNQILVFAQITLRDGDVKKSMRQYTILIEKGVFLDLIITELQYATKNYPKEIITWQTLGNAYKRAHREEDAVDAYDTAQEIADLSTGTPRRS